MSVRRSSPPRRRASSRVRAPELGARASDAAIVRLLDDDIDEYTLGDWRARNLRLVEELFGLGLIDPQVVSLEAHRFLTDTLLQAMNGAAVDPQNAGHVRAQNENVLHYGLAARVPRRTLSIALAAGFVHDLNKAVGEPLRQDEYAVRDARGHRVPAMTTMAQLVGLNHLGERTRATIFAATRIPKGALDPALAGALDRCIVHHGLGSSRFIAELVEGRNPWWGAEFVDPATGERRLVHPAQPPLTLESIVHDLADSTQQMQGGAAWLMKYPAGYWRASDRSLADMLSGGDEAADAAFPMSLRLQIQVETSTCRAIIAAGLRAGILEDPLALRLEDAVSAATASSVRWIDASPAYLADPEGESVYHDVGRALGVPADAARRHLGEARAGSPEAARLEPLLWRSGRRVDLARARALAFLLTHCV